MSKSNSRRANILDDAAMSPPATIVSRDSESAVMDEPNSSNYIEIGYFKVGEQDGFKAVSDKKNYIISQLKTILMQNKSLDKYGENGCEITSMYVPDSVNNTGYLIVRVYFGINDMEHDWLFSNRAKGVMPNGKPIGKHIIDSVLNFRGIGPREIVNSDADILNELKAQALLRGGIVVTFPKTHRHGMANTLGYTAAMSFIKPDDVNDDNDAISEIMSQLSQETTYNPVYNSQISEYSHSQLSEISKASKSDTHITNKPAGIFIGPYTRPPVPLPTQFFEQLTDHGAKVYPIDTSGKVDDADILNMYSLPKAFDTAGKMVYHGRGKESNHGRAIKNETIFVDVLSFARDSRSFQRSESANITKLAEEYSEDVYGFALRPQDIDGNTYPVVLLYTANTRNGVLNIVSDWQPRQPNVDALAAQVSNGNIHPLHAAAMKFAGDNLVGLLHHQKLLLNEKFGAQIGAEILTWTHDMRAALLNGLGIYPVTETMIVTGIREETHLSAFASASARNPDILGQEQRLSMVLFMNESFENDQEKIERMQELISADAEKKAIELKQKALNVKRDLFEKFKTDYSNYIRNLARVVNQLMKSGIRNLTAVDSLRDEFQKLKSQQEYINSIVLEDHEELNVHDDVYFPDGSDSKIGSAENPTQYLTLLHKFESVDSIPNITNITINDMAQVQSAKIYSEDDVLKKISEVSSAVRTRVAPIKFVETPQNVGKRRTKSKKSKSKNKSAKKQQSPNELVKLSKQRRQAQKSQRLAISQQKRDQSVKEKRQNQKGDNKTHKRRY